MEMLFPSMRMLIYGYKITSTAPGPLYIDVLFRYEWFEHRFVILLIFTSHSNARIIYLFPVFRFVLSTGVSKNSADVSLPPGESLAIGYGASGTVPRGYIVPEGQAVDVGFLKLFISTKYVDLSGIVQPLPFSETRGNVVYQPKVVHQCFTMRVASIQKKKENQEEGASQC
ncbi:hypothetical protein F5146DRAFT_771205 [Armillaria mellea]|nr:hypothetical protein F5146DRAFT_771205 [Armillaria mellea]